ncbi:MAG: tetratricopeptide repeat protein [Candidatus Hodarchaeales archaeon]
MSIRRFFKRDDIKSKAFLEAFNKINSQIQESALLIDNGEYNKGLVLVEAAIKDSEENNIPILMVDAFISKVKASIELGRFNDCLELIDECEKLLQSIEQAKKNELVKRKATLDQLRGKVFRKKDDLDAAQELFLNSLSIRESQKNMDFEIASSLNDIALCYALKGHSDLALEHFQQSLDLFIELGSESASLKVMNNLGLIHAYNSDKDKAYDYYQKSQELIIKNKNKPSESALLLNTGLLYLDEGKLPLALDNIKKSLMIYEEIQNKFGLALSLSIFGLIFEIKGELDQALELHNRSLTIFEDLNNKQKIAMSYNNIGNIHQIEGDHEKALEYYEKSLKILNENGNNLEISATLLNLISVAFHGDAVDKAIRDSYFQKLQELSKKDKNKLIDLTFRLAKAIKLKNSKRVIKKAEAQRIFQKIVEEKVIQHEYTVTAMKNLCELLMQELQDSGSQDVLNEVKSLLEKLITIAENQKSFSLLAESYMIKSKIAILELDINSARQLLGQAEQIAEEKGLKKLLMLISREYDSLIEQSDKLTDVTDQVSMAERLEMAELQSMVTRIIKQKTDRPKLLEEEAVLFLIVGKSGLSIYCKQFAEESLLEEQLIGGFLTAINAFTDETFSDSGAIDGIKHKDYTLLMKPIDNLLGCYVFKGQSYFALQKLRKFTEFVKTSDIAVDILSEADNIGMDVSENPMLGQIVQTSFLTSPEEMPQSITYGFFAQKMTAAIKHGIYLDMS